MSHEVCLTGIHLCVACFLRGHPGGELCAKMPLFRLRKNRYTTTIATHSDGPAGPQ